MSRLIACFVLALAAGPVAACINDAELPNSEREFRSQYRDPIATPTPPLSEAAPESTGRVSLRLLAGGGLVLLTAALALTLTNRRVKG